MEQNNKHGFKFHAAKSTVELHTGDKIQRIKALLKCNYNRTYIYKFRLAEIYSNKTANNYPNLIYRDYI